MTPAESLALTRFVRAACPQQRFDEYTPDAWHELLADLRFDDCRAAVTALAKRQPFVSPAEIRGEVRRIRAARLQAAGTVADPDYDRDDVRGGIEAIRARRRAVADGRANPAVMPPDPEGQKRVAKLIGETIDRLPAIPVPDYGHNEASKAFLRARIDRWTPALPPEVAS